MQQSPQTMQQGPRRPGSKARTPPRTNGSEEVPRQWELQAPDSLLGSLEIILGIITILEIILRIITILEILLGILSILEIKLSITSDYYSNSSRYS